MKAYRYLKKKGIRAPYISYYLGKEKTTLGLGYIFEYVKPSSTKLEELNTEELKEKVNRLYLKCVDEAIIMQDLKLENLVMDVNGDLNIVDGLGCTTLIPLCYWSKFFARKKLKRKFTSLLNSL